MYSCLLLKTDIFLNCLFFNLTLFWRSKVNLTPQNQYSKGVSLQLEQVSNRYGRPKSKLWKFEKSPLLTKIADFCQNSTKKNSPLFWSLTVQSDSSTPDPGTPDIWPKTPKFFFSRSNKIHFFSLERKNQR